MSQTGIYLERLIIGMMTKYEVEIDNSVFCTNLNRLTKKECKLIPMYEKKDDWCKQLKTVLVEIVGLNEIFSSNPLFLQCIAKLEGLIISTVEFELFRKTVFEVISLLQELKNGK